MICWGALKLDTALLDYLKPSDKDDQNVPTPTPTSTHTPTPQPTPPPVPTATPEPTSTSTATPTFSPTPTPEAVAQTPRYVFGPESGAIEHNTRDGLIDTYRANVLESDTVIEARFFNPYSSQAGSWSSGFFFRHSDANVAHIVVVSSNGAWHHYLRTGDIATQQDLAAEYSNHIDTTAGGSNQVRVIANGSEGWLFINGSYVDNLDLSGLTSAGNVSAVGSYFQEDGIAGKSTRFEDFTIRRLSIAFGPRDGNIEHKIHSTGFIDTFDSRVSLSDGVVEATFINPYASSLGDWSNGFIIRDSGDGEFHAIAIEEGGYWNHRLRTGDANASQELATQYSNLISIISNGSNHIRVIVLGDEGWLFINSTYTDQLDLSGWTESGQVSAVTQLLHRGRHCRLLHPLRGLHDLVSGRTVITDGLRNVNRTYSEVMMWS